MLPSDQSDCLGQTTATMQKSPSSEHPHTLTCCSKSCICSLLLLCVAELPSFLVVITWDEIASSSTLWNVLIDLIGEPWILGFSLSSSNMVLTTSTFAITLVASNSSYMSIYTNYVNGNISIDKLDDPNHETWTLYIKL